MITTIDKAGRIVIPKVLRESLHFSAESPIEVERVGNEIRIRSIHNEPVFREVDGVLVHHGGEVGQIDITAFIQNQRDQHALSKGTGLIGQ